MIQSIADRIFHLSFVLAALRDAEQGELEAALAKSARAPTDARLEIGNAHFLGSELCRTQPCRTNHLASYRFCRMSAPQSGVLDALRHI